MAMLDSFIAAIIISAASFIGLIFGSTIAKKIVSRHLKYLVSFSAGVFFFTSFNLFKEAFEIASPYLIFSGAIGGFLFFFLLERILPESHHHHSGDCEHSHAKSGATRMLLGDAFHNIADGIIIVPAFFVSTTVGIITTVSILIHEILQETSEYFVLIGLGYSRWQAISRNVLVSLTIFIGVFIGFTVSSTEAIQAVLLSFSAGAFMYIIFHDLIPLSILKGNKRKAFSHVSFFIFGVLLLFLISVSLPHAH
jgi:zinc and cadmium transporter